MVTLVKPVQQSKALSSIDMTLFGMVMLVKFAQFKKALVPIIFTLSGMVTLANSVQSRVLRCVQSNAAGGDALRACGHHY